MYLQIVCVVREELAEYKRAWPDLNFFALPPPASERGIGASRFYMKKLATKVSNPDFPFCMMMDDSVKGFQGFTLARDPEDLFDKRALQHKSQMEDIPLRFALEHFMSDDFTDRDKFGTIGFHASRGGIKYVNAYKRAHTNSAYIMNLEKLRDVHFNKDVWIMEDLVSEI
jgi:hypothetical protein